MTAARQRSAAAGRSLPFDHAALPQFTRMIPDRSFRLVMVAAVVSSLLSIAGCSSESPVEVPEELKVDLTSLAKAPPELEIAHRAVLNRCMHAAGFDLPFDSSVDRDRGATLIGVAGIFSSLESAKALGYQSTQVEEAAPIDKYEASLPASSAAAYRVAYSGGEGAKEVSLTLSSGTVVSRSTEGCFARADVAVYGSVKNRLKVESFMNEVWAQSVSYVADTDTALQNLFPKYHRCMLDAGYEIEAFGADKLAKQRFGAYRSANQQPSAEEQRMAGTDYTCQRRTGFAGALNTIFLQKSSTWILQNEGLILGSRELTDAAKARANEIINAG